MAKVQKTSSSSSGRSKASSKGASKSKKKNSLPAPHPQRGGVEMVDPLVRAQMKLYEEAMGLFHQQKFQRSKQELEKVLEGPSKELADRARTHLRIVEQRMKPSSEQNPKSPEEHYQRGVAMMNLGRWDEARESLEKARRIASTRATTKTLLSFRKTPASRNCCILKKMVTPDNPGRSGSSSKHMHVFEMWRLP